MDNIHTKNHDFQWNRIHADANLIGETAEGVMNMGDTIYTEKYIVL